MKRLVMLLMCCALYVGCNTGCNKTESGIKEYDYNFNMPTMSEYYIGKTAILKAENERLIQENENRINRNNAIIAVLEKYGYKEATIWTILLNFT